MVNKPRDDIPNETSQYHIGDEGSPRKILSAVRLRDVIDFVG